MGLYDYIRCCEVSEKEFQTKDTPAQFLECYEIRKDGYLWHEKCDYEDKSDPNAKGLYKLRGAMTATNKRWVKENFTGEIAFGDSETLFIATFFKGKLKSFIESKGEDKLRYYVDKEGA